MTRRTLTLVTALAAPVALAAQDAPPSPETVLAEGKRLYETVCVSCHTMDPPPKLAPPMTHVARHYRQAFTSEEEAVAAMVAYLRKPDAARSKMPKMAHERFGLMPAVPLSEPQLRAVSRYVWTLEGAQRGP